MNGGKLLRTLTLAAGALAATSMTAGTAEARRWVRHAYRAPVVYRAPRARVRVAAPYYATRAYRGVFGFGGYGYGRGVSVRVGF